jgi:hypothetical protein
MAIKLLLLLTLTLFAALAKIVKDAARHAKERRARQKIYFQYLVLKRQRDEKAQSDLAEMLNCIANLPGHQPM